MEQAAIKVFQLTRNTLFLAAEREDRWCANLNVSVIGRLAAVPAGNKPGRTPG